MTMRDTGSFSVSIKKKVLVGSYSSHSLEYKFKDCLRGQFPVKRVNEIKLVVSW